MTTSGRTTIGLLLACAGLAGCGLQDSGVTTAGASGDGPIDDCVALVQYQVYVGEPDGVAVWERAGSTDEGLRAECESLATTDPATLAAMHDRRVELQQFFDEVADAEAQAPGAASGTETTVEEPAPGCHPNYGGCVPIASDVDCLGHGDGPEYVALAVLVFGEDVYGLDPDGDGLGCEAHERR